MVDATFDKTTKPLVVGLECPSKDVQWGDVNGDGLDDFICLDSVRVFLSVRNLGTDAVDRMVFHTCL